MSPGILHYYFRDKRAILGRAAATVMADLDRRVATEARGARDARGRLRALLRACLEVATESRDFWTVFIELWGEALHDRELARLNRRAYARARRFLAASVARGTAAGAFRQVAPDEAAAVILALVDGLSLQLTFDPDLMPLGRAVRLAEEALGAYLGAAGPAGRAGRTAMADAARVRARPPARLPPDPRRRRSTRRGSGRASARPRPSSRRRWRASRERGRAGRGAPGRMDGRAGRRPRRPVHGARGRGAPPPPRGPPAPGTARLRGAALRRRPPRAVDGAGRGPAGGQRRARRGAEPAPSIRAPGIRAPVTAPAVLVVSAPEAGGAPDIFAAELTWPEYALVQRLHFLDHRAQVRALRAALAASA